MTERRGPPSTATARWVAWGAVALVAAIAAGAVLLPPDGIWGIAHPLGVLTLGAVLGYSVSLAIAPGRLEHGGRMALSLGVALGAPFVIALLLTATPWGLGRLQFVIAMVAIVVASAAIAALGGRSPSPPSWRVGRPRAGTLVGIMVYGGATLLVVAAFVLRLGVASGPGPPFTELWVEPDALRNGAVVAHVVNHEGGTVAYRLDLVDLGRVVASVPAVVRSGEEWVQPIQAAALQGQRVEARLYRLPEVSSVYRRLAFTIPAAGSSPSAPPSG